METDQGLRERFEKVARGAYLDVLLPKSTDFDAATLIKDGTPGELARAPSRRNLFFDEKAQVVLVLRVAAGPDDVGELLSNLEIGLAAHATDGLPQGNGNAASASGKHDLSSKTISASKNSEVVATRDQTYVIWKPKLHLARPRVRLQRPTVYFTANLGIKSHALAAPPKPEADYLEPFDSLPRNVLEPLNAASEFRNKHVFLSEDRITKVAPKPARREDAVRPIRGATKRAFPTLPALYTRIKYSSVPDGIIASLHIETSQVVAGTFSIDGVELYLPSSESRRRNAGHQGSLDAQGPHEQAEQALQCLGDAMLPLRMSAGDERVVLYHLRRKGLSNAPQDPPVISVSIRATTTSEQGAHVELDMSWQSQVDVKDSTLEPSYKWSRTLSTASLHQKQPSAQSSGRPTSSSETHHALPGEAGVTFFFTALQATNQDEDFRLTIKCINKSARARRFAIMPLRQKQPQATAVALPEVGNADLVAGIFNAPILERQKPADTFCHTPDVRIGPLLPGAALDAHMDLRAMTTGVLNMGTLRIEDLDTGQTLDVTDLPDTIALENLEDSQPQGQSNFVITPSERTLLEPEQEEAAAEQEKENELWDYIALQQSGRPVFASVR